MKERFALQKLCAVVFLFVVVSSPTSTSFAKTMTGNSHRKVSLGHLSVFPVALTYKVDLERKTVQIKHFTITNLSEQPIQITVNTPTNTSYVITSPAQVYPSGGILTVPAKIAHSNSNKLKIDVAFMPTDGGDTPSAQITILANDGSGESATIDLNGSASNSTEGLWVGGFQFISEFEGQALEQSGDSNPALAFVDKEFEGPLWMTFDTDNNLWISFQVANSSPITLVEISRTGLHALRSGADVKAKVLLTPQGATGTTLPLARSFDFDVTGNLWATDQYGSAILEFPASQIKKSGSPPPAISLGTSTSFVPEVMRFDHSGNLWISVFPTQYPSPPMQIWKFAPTDRVVSGPVNPSLIVDLSDQLDAVDLAFDASDNLWVAGSSPQGDEVEMFSLVNLEGTGEGSPPSAVTITSPAFAGLAGSGSCLGGLDFDRSGDLWVSIGTNNADCGAQTQVVQFTPAQLAAGGNLSPSVSIMQNPAKTNLFLNGPLRLGPAL